MGGRERSSLASNSGASSRPEKPTIPATGSARRRPTKSDIIVPCENPTSARSLLLSPRCSMASSMKASRIGAAARTPPNTASGLRSCELNH
jgi:hypothetical protein